MFQSFILGENHFDFQLKCSDKYPKKIMYLPSDADKYFTKDKVRCGQIFSLRESDNFPSNKKGVHGFEFLEFVNNNPNIFQGGKEIIFRNEKGRTFSSFYILNHIVIMDITKVSSRPDYKFPNKNIYFFTFVR